jgi:hypothetical protein
VAAQLSVHAQGGPPAPLPLLDVPFISQSELLCGGAAAAMVMRYWGERGVTAESFAGLVDRSAAGIRTDALVAELNRRGWQATGIEGTSELIAQEAAQGRPVLTLIEDRPGAFHYVVIVAWHERGVVFHDPARAPFRVMTQDEFARRWNAGDRWMAVVLPAAGVRPSDGTSEVGAEASIVSVPGETCDGRVAAGVAYAQGNDLAAAERVLSAAVGCPAAMRELAGVRVRQRRWDEAADLAAAAVETDPRDDYAWRVLGTSRFVQNDRVGALAAWNGAGEPRLDLISVAGLIRTRHRVVERLVRPDLGQALTPRAFVRARRRLEELPAASSTRLDYMPVSGGLAELRGVVAERPALPSGWLWLAGTGISAAAGREVRLTTGSLSGGGERFTAAWRFWPHRPRVSAGLDAPAPWGGIAGVHASLEKQAFTEPALAPAERTSARAGVADWATAGIRWSAAAGIDEWAGGGTHAALAAGLRLVSMEDRADLTAGAETWPGAQGFGVFSAAARARSTREMRGPVFTGTAGVAHATARSPLHVWWAADTGHAREVLLRAHPLLDDGRIRAERLGRTLLHGSIEAQHWWLISGAVRAAAAVFVDTARTSRRLERTPLADVDAGIGGRVSVAGIPGVFRADVGRGLRDGATAFSFVYEP